MRLSELRPGWRTDFIVHRFDAQIAELDDCIRVRTPTNPTFYWGNFLLLPRSPRDDELEHWLARFHDEISAHEPACRHVAIGINGAPGATPLPRWEAAGFERNEAAVVQLRPSGLRLPRQARGEVTFRCLELPRDLEALVQLQCAETDGFEPTGYAEFRRRQMWRIAAMAEQGIAAWFALWCDGVMAAECGLIRDSRTPGATGRFQHVTTHPAWRRRGQ